ncbi:MAG: hypothetical protein NVS2B5_10900 [Beijerinckiaceae bacterium]
MSMSASSSFAPEREERLSRKLRAWLPLCLPAAAVAALAIALRIILPENPDTSWIITICEKILAGAHLYTDILETNPPATIWLYMPSVVLAHLIGLSPEAVIDTGTFFAALASILLCLCIADRAGGMRSELKGWLVAAAALVLLVLPARAFTEREQIAVIAIAPYLVLSIVRLEGRAMSLLHAVIAGIGIGIAVSIKPHFGASVVLVALVVALIRRDWRGLFVPEHFVAAGIFTAYVAAALCFCPDYLRVMLPLVRAVYIPVRLQSAMLFGTAFKLTLAAILLAFLSTRHSPDRARYWLAFAATAGFAAAFVQQGKGWSYHAYPMLAVATFAALAAIIRENTSAAGPSGFERLASRLASGIAACVLCVGIFNVLMWQTDYPALADAIRRVKERPSIAVVSADLALAHPLVRSLHGTYAGRVCDQWIASGAMVLLDDKNLDEGQRAELRRLQDFDADLLAENLARNRPDVLLVERDAFFVQWASAHDNVARELTAYRSVDRVEGVEIYTRRTDSDAAGS